MKEGTTWVNDQAKWFIISYFILTQLPFHINDWVQFTGYCINKCKQIVYIFIDKLIDGADHEVELLEALEVNVSISFNFLTRKSLIHKNDL